ncbi:MAG: hypothetical protein PVJ64_01050 [Gemmatimonadales bacterium]|jgi:hypothetical protein
MRWLRIFPCLALAATLAACSEQPAEPGFDEAVVPALGVTHNEWMTTESMPDEGFPDYVECAYDGAGESVLWFGSWDVYWHSTTTPSGNETWHWKVDYSSATLYFLGQASGDEWLIYRGEDTGAQVIRTPGEFQVHHWQANEWYRNQDGENLHLRFRYRLHIDADGNTKMDRFDGYCPGKP